MAVHSVNLALLVKSTLIPEWQYLMLQRLLVIRGIRLSLVICDKPPTENTISLPSLGLRMIKAMDRIMFRSTGRPVQGRSLKGLYNTSQVRNLDDPDLESVFSERGVDIVLNPEGIMGLPGYLYEHSKYGIWTLFFDFCRGTYDEWTGVRAHAQGNLQLFAGIVAQLEPEELDRKYLFLTSGSTNKLSLSQSVEPVLWKMAGIVPDLVSRLRDSTDPFGFMAVSHQRFAAEMKSHRLETEVCTPPDWRLLWQLFVKCTRSKYITAQRKLLTPQCWVLLYGERTELGKLDCLIPPRDRYWADPHLVEYQHRHFIFMEEWLYKTGKGRISFIEWFEDNSFSESVTILEKDYHLSYPHVFQYKGDYYMIPESADNKTVELYRCTRFPDRWQFVKHLMRDVEAYDATLHHYDGRWWMFANMRDHEGSSPNDLLYLFSADSPLSDDWESHPCNPIVTHALSARSAGSIIHLGNKVYRPSQNCAGSYGRGLNLNQVMVWTREQYKERTLRQYIPNGESKLKGMHTFSMAGEKILSDGIYGRRRWVRE